jgi:hypothetical protein
MKRLLKTLFVAAPLLGIGCVPNDSSIHILNAFPYQNALSNGACQALSIGIEGGSLDLSGNTAYILQWTVESTLEIITSNISNEPAFQGPQRNDWIANQIVYSYTTVPALNPPLADETYPISWRIPAGATASSSNFIGLNMIGPTAAAQLLNAVRVGTSVQLVVTYYLRGQLASGQKLDTNKVSYPIYVYNTGFPVCAAGVKRIPSGPCGYAGGQDGTLVGCCGGTPPPTGC